MQLQKYKTNSYDLSDIESCELKWAFSHGLFKDLTKQNHGDIPDMDFTVFGRYVHTMFKMFFLKNYKTPGSFAGTGIGLWTVYLDRVDAYERHPQGIRGYTPRIRPMMEEFHGMNQDRKAQTIGFEVPGRTYVNTGKYLVGLGGRIDRLWKRNGREVATDYKTTTKRKDADSLRREPQFIIHSLMRRQSVGEFPEIEVYYPGFSTGKRTVPTKIVTFTINQDDLNEFYKRLDAAGDKMRSVRGRMKEKIEPQYGDHCFLCDFALTGTCDEYTGGNDNVQYRSSLRIAPRRIPIKRVKKEYVGLVRLKGWPRKYAIVVGPSSGKDTTQATLFEK